MSQKLKWIIILSVSFLLLGLMGYFVDRSQFPLYIYFALFALYFVLLRDRKRIPEAWLMAYSLATRILLIGAIPLLSDDFYRFIWDGILSNNGISPFAFIPSEIPLDTVSGLNADLLTKLNSPDYISVYPPLVQWIFSAATALFPSSTIGQVVIMKLPLVLADIGLILILKKLLRIWNFDVSKVWIYALNPLAIIEFSGNMHLEVYMLFFVAATFLFWSQHKFMLSGLSMGFAIAAKILPLMILPLLLTAKATMKDKLRFFVVLGCVSLVLCWPLLKNPKEVQLFFTSIQLYFQTFEFNASLYYVFRAIGYAWVDYNTIGIIGKLSSLMVFILAIILAGFYRNKDLRTGLKGMFVLWSVYLFLASIVHPWYTLPLLFFAVLAQGRFAVIWTMLVGLSYIGYHADGYSHNYVLVSIEYLLVIGVLMYEFRSFWLPKKSMK